MELMGRLLASGFRLTLAVVLLSLVPLLSGRTCTFQRERDDVMRDCEGWHFSHASDGHTGFVVTNGLETNNATIAPLTDATNTSKTGASALSITTARLTMVF